MKKKYLVKFRAAVRFEGGVFHLFKDVWMPFVPYPNLGCEFQGLRCTLTVESVVFDTETGEAKVNVFLPSAGLDRDEAATIASDFKCWGWTGEAR